MLVESDMHAVDSVPDIYVLKACCGRRE
jgi:hypothetical protein